MASDLNLSLRRKELMAAKVQTFTPSEETVKNHLINLKSRDAEAVLEHAPRASVRMSPQVKAARVALRRSGDGPRRTG